MYSQAEALKTQKCIYETETYIKKSLQRQLKSALARVCINCTNNIVSELHILLHSSLYNHRHHVLFLKYIKAPQSG